MNKKIRISPPEFSVEEKTPFQALTAMAIFGVVSFLYSYWSGYYAHQILFWEDYLFEIVKHVLLWTGLTVFYYGAKNTWTSFQYWLIVHNYWKNREVIKRKRIARKLLISKMRSKQ